MQKRNNSKCAGIRSGESFWKHVLVSYFNKWNERICTGGRKRRTINSVNLVIIMVLSVHWKRLQIMLMMMPFPKNYRRRPRGEHLKRILSIQWLNNRDSLTLTCDTATATSNNTRCFSRLAFYFISFLLSQIDVCLLKLKKMVNLWILFVALHINKKLDFLFTSIFSSFFCCCSATRCVK